MYKSDVLGIRASRAMGEFFGMRSKYRERPTKRGKERLAAKSKAVSKLLNDSISAMKKEPKWA